MVRYALLGLLRERRDYGYQLKRRFDERMGAVWRLNIGQVYQTLRALERIGLIAEVNDGATAETGRRVFRLTAKGGRVLERWLQRPPMRPRPVRDETLVRLLVVRPAGSREALGRITEQERLYKRHLARLVAQKRRAMRNGGEVLGFGELGLEAALLHGEAHLKWLEHCRRCLEHMDEGAGEQKGDRTGGHK
ncbi:PadR family transcriptional regulator [Candidatus Binatia bacterium]|nr:PadR family transcriptional regulator [Candidatus Binatia bacterium]